MGVALLSQAKKSECGIAQPSFYIDGDNVRHTPRTEAYLSLTKVRKKSLSFGAIIALYCLVHDWT